MTNLDNMFDTINLSSSAYQDIFHEFAAEIELQCCTEGKPLWFAMATLLRAAVYAHDSGRNVWEFAIGIHELEEHGLAPSEFRWLMHKGFVIHAIETTANGETTRAFRNFDSQCLGRMSVFVLTELGLRKAFDWKCVPRIGSLTPLDSGGEERIAPAAPRIEEEVLRPKWDPLCRLVSFNGAIVKQFKLPSPNQIAILSAFEEEGWPRRIDDPLPPRSDIDPKQRLHDTLRSINRNQRNRLLQFSGDGTGCGVVWSPIPVGSLGELDDPIATE